MEEELFEEIMEIIFEEKIKIHHMFGFQFITAIDVNKSLKIYNIDNDHYRSKAFRKIRSNNIKIM